MPAEPLNLVFIMADQLRPDFLGCYGAGFIETPNIDRLAASGVRFTHAYSEHPVCVPARASLMLGMHASRTGVLDNSFWIRPDYRACGLSTWPELLAEQGYLTAGIGKMHFYPWDARLGFQYRTIAEDKRWIHVDDDYQQFLRSAGERKHHGNEHEGYFENKGAIVNLLPWELQVDRWVGQEGCRFLRERGTEGPFAMMVSFPGPHCPYDPAAEFLVGLDPAAMPEPVPDAGDTPILRAQNHAGNRAPWNGVDHSDWTVDQKRVIRQHYAAEVRQLDGEIGALLDTLDDLDLRKHTVIIFTSDHGDCLGDHDLIGKTNYYDSSFHIPLIVSAPGGEICTVRDDLVALTDVTATLLRLAGQPVPAAMDSRPLPGVGIPDATGRDHLICALSGGWAIQEGPWRLARYATGETTFFNFVDDPDEQRNLAASTGESVVFRRLDTLLVNTMMRAAVGSHFPQKLPADAHSSSKSFGREGWVRPYPVPIAT